MADRNGYIGRAPSDSSVVVARQTFHRQVSPPTFTFASGYTIGYFDVFLNGAKQIEGQDYDANDSSTFEVLVVEPQMAMSLRQLHIKHLTYLM